MKLCHVVPSLEEQHGGPSKSVQALCAALAHSGHEVELLTTAPGKAIPTQVDGRLQTTFFRRDWPQRLCRSATMKNCLAATTADVVHHHALWLRTLHYAHASAVEHQATFVVSPRGMMSQWAWAHHRGRKKLAGWFIHRGALEAVDGWHATSKAEAAEIRALGFSQPVCVAPNGIEPPQANRVDEARIHWNTLCPDTRTRPVALFYSRFHSKKRVLELIRVWLDHAPPEWLLLLVGIPQEYTPAALESYAREHGGAARVRAFDGLGQPPPYAVASLFLLPSHNENFGMAIAEALAHGVPAVVTDTTPWHELGRQSLGWCVAWPVFGSAIRDASALSPEELRARGARARTWALQEFSWHASARRLGEFYAEVQNGARSTRT